MHPPHTWGHIAAHNTKTPEKSAISLKSHKNARDLSPSVPVTRVVGNSDLELGTLTLCTCFDLQDNPHSYQCVKC